MFEERELLQDIRPRDLQVGQIGNQLSYIFDL